jgi:hypothetical protein
MTPSAFTLSLPASYHLHQPHRLPKGVIVGTVEIIDCKPACFGSYKYKLTNPKRLRKHLVPKNEPNPLWWRPQFK